MIVLERLMLAAVWLGVAGFFFIGLASAWALAFDPETRKAFVAYWKKEV